MILLGMVVMLKIVISLTVPRQRWLIGELYRSEKSWLIKSVIYCLVYNYTNFQSSHQSRRNRFGSSAGGPRSAAIDPFQNPSICSVWSQIVRHSDSFYYRSLAPYTKTPNIEFPHRSNSTFPGKSKKSAGRLNLARWKLCKNSMVSFCRWTFSLGNWFMNCLCIVR